jgi:hypothetical protein
MQRRMIGARQKGGDHHEVAADMPEIKLAAPSCCQCRTGRTVPLKSPREHPRFHSGAMEERAEWSYLQQ